MRHIVFASLLLVLSGCWGKNNPHLRKHLSVVTGCPAERIEVLELESSVMRVNACGEVKTCFFRSGVGSSAMSQSYTGHWECP